METNNNLDANEANILPRVIELIKQESRNTHIKQKEIFDWFHHRGNMVAKMARAKIINRLIYEGYPKWLIARAFNMRSETFNEYLKFDFQWPEETQ